MNLSRVRVFGFELQGDVRLQRGFSLLGALSYAEGDDLERDEPLNSIDPLKVVAGLRYLAPANRYGGDLISTFTNKKRRIDDSVVRLTPSPGYGILDVLGYYNFSKRATLNLGVFNLFDKKYFLWSDLQGIGIAGGATGAIPLAATLDRFSQPGINARVTFRYQF